MKTSLREHVNFVNCNTASAICFLPRVKKAKKIAIPWGVFTKFTCSRGQKTSKFALLHLKNGGCGGKNGRERRAMRIKANLFNELYVFLLTSMRSRCIFVMRGQKNKDWRVNFVNIPDFEVHTVVHGRAA